MQNDGSSGDYGKRSWLGNMKDKFLHSDEIEEEFEDEHLAIDQRRHQQAPSRIPNATRIVNVAVRQPQSFEDARIAADGLKDGRQQIINLEKTNQDVSERIIDFLMGVTYALNGFVEKVGDRVYLFAPSNVTIDCQDDMRKPNLGIFDRGF